MQKTPRKIIHKKEVCNEEKRDHFLYDIPGNQTDRYVATSVVSDTSSAMIQFEGFTANVDDYYITANYTIEFMPGGLIQVFNVSQLKTYLYNTSALSDGEGFAIVNRDDPNSA